MAKTKTETQTDSKIQIEYIPIQNIDKFPNHPFKVVDDEDMERLIESIRENGMQSPIVVRPKEDGRYEVISGHRRLYACKRLGIESIEACIREMTRDEAIIALVDSNIQREHILPSEKAFAYKMKMEALNRQGKRTDLTLLPMATKLQTDSAAEIAKEANEGRNQVFRYIRLTELIPEILELVDSERIAFRPAVEISYLTEEQQRDLLETFETDETTPSLAQAIRLKKLSQDGKLDTDTIFSIMSEEKPNQIETVKFKKDEIKRFFPERTSPDVMKQVIVRLLTAWQKSREQKQMAKNSTGDVSKRTKDRDDSAR